MWRRHLHQAKTGAYRADIPDIYPDIPDLYPVIPDLYPDIPDLYPRHSRESGNPEGCERERGRPRAPASLADYARTYPSASALPRVPLR